MTDPSRLWNPIERKCLSLLQDKSLHTKPSLLQLYAFILRHTLDSNLNLITKLISSLPSVDLPHARRVFDQLPHRSDAYLCNTMIKSHMISGQFSEAISLYTHLRRNERFVPDNYTFSTLAKCCGLRSLLWPGMEVHGQAMKYGFVEGNLYVATALVDMYGKLGQMGCAQKVFDEMPERSSVSWTALVTGYVRMGDMGAAKGVFEATPGGKKDVAAYNVMVDGYVKLGEMDLAKALFDGMSERNVVTWTTMIDGCCSNGDVEGGRALFDAMPRRNLCSWNAMIGGYSWNGRPHEAVALFWELMAGGMFEPDDVTIVSVLPAVADLGALDVGDWIYVFVKRKRLDGSANVATALVNMYAKCGEIEKARRVFDEVQGRKTCTWNALINGLALNGCAEEALQVFHEMQVKGFKLNEITILGVLSACSHGGLVEEGKRWFNKMGEFGLTPKIEHYGCMVDLLGKARHVDEVEKLIESMPYEANGIILSSLLFSYGYANDVSRAEKVEKKLIDLEPSNDGNYIMLRNLYASERRWKDVERIKKLMVMNGAKKEVGCSVIEIDNQVLKFVAGDNVHSGLEATHTVLDQLWIHMRARNSLLNADFKASEV